MTGSTDSELERQAAKRYVDQGYEVVFQPAPEQLPFDLGGYQPDFLAVRDDSKLIVEVKSIGFASSLDKYVSVADEVRKHPPWRFVLVTERDVLEDPTASADESLPTWDQILSRLNQVENGTARGRESADLLVTWALLEASLRRHAVDTGLPVQRLPTSALIRQLYSQGELPAPYYESASQYLALRNEVAHGFQRIPTSSDIASLHALLKQVLAEWKIGVPAK